MVDPADPTEGDVVDPVKPRGGLVVVVVVPVVVVAVVPGGAGVTEVVVPPVRGAGAGASVLDVVDPSTVVDSAIVVEVEVEVEVVVSCSFVVGGAVEGGAPVVVVVVPGWVSAAADDPVWVTG